MNADKNKTVTTVILNVSEESYTPALNYYNKQDPSTSLRYGQDDRNDTVICIDVQV